MIDGGIDFRMNSRSRRTLLFFRFRPRMNCQFARAIALAVLAACICIGAHGTESAKIETVAGTGSRGFSGDGKAATEAQLNNPFGVIVGPDGDIYFCDTGNHVIRKISRRTGKISTVAGTGKKGYSGDGGPAAEAALFEPYEIRFHPGGDLYWVEMQNHIIRKLDARSGKVETFAGTGEKGFGGDGGSATDAKFNRPHSIQFDRAGENLFVCDIGNHRIRRINLEKGAVDTWCGTGKPESTPDGAKVSPKTPLKGPRALDIDPDGDLWLALREGNQVFRIDMKKSTLHHVAGSGQKGFAGNGGSARKAQLSGPKGVAISPDGKLVYLADTESHSVRAIDLRNSPPTLELIAGDGRKGDGPDRPDPRKCRMARLHGVGIDPLTGDLYAGDSETNKIRKISHPEVLPVEEEDQASAYDSNREEFNLAGRKCIVVKPAKPAENKPWIWRCRFFGAFDQADRVLVEKGWHVAWIDVANLFGGPEAMAVFDHFYRYATLKLGLSATPVMEGFSRGGLPAMNFAIRYPERVAAIYLDAPVLDIHTWPKEGAPKLWPVCLGAYGLAEKTAGQWKGPLDGLKPLVDAKIPILAVCGGADQVVPFPRNSGILEKRYTELGGTIHTIVKAGCDHHPHSLYDPAPIVSWITKQAEIAAPPKNPKEAVTGAADILIRDKIDDGSFRNELKKAITQLYEHRDYREIWTDANRPVRKNSRLIHNRIRICLEVHGLASEQLHHFDSDAEIPGGLPVSRDELNATLTLLDAGLLLRFGPHHLQSLWKHYDNGKLLEEWVARLGEKLDHPGVDPIRVLAESGPSNPVYEGLLKFYQAKRNSLKNPKTPFKPIELPKGAKSVKPGNGFPDAKRFATKLEEDGFLDKGIASKIEEKVFTPELSEALKEFQRVNQLATDGILGKQSLAALNLSPEEKLIRLELNLQRARQLPDSLGNRTVFVNIPSGRMEAYEKGKRREAMRVVFGQNKEGRRTPLFHDTMEYVVFRPYWRVPPGIVTEEIAPDTVKDPMSFYKKGYEIVSGFGDDRALPPTWENLTAAAEGRLRLRQRPGNGNALGLVKFLFPNSHSVYMHDTPADHLFSLSRRDFSHGCIRLQFPDKMAKFVLGEQGWDEKRIQSAMHGKSRISVTIDDPVKVFIVYFTAWPDLENADRILWMPDIYSRDDPEWKAITEASAPKRKAESQSLAKTGLAESR